MKTAQIKASKKTMVVAAIIVIILVAMVQLQQWKIPLTLFRESVKCSYWECLKREVSPPEGTSQEDPALAAYIRRLLVAPSVLPYNLTHPEYEHFSQNGEKQYSMTDLLNQTDGFFVEAGAADGEFLSNTLFLERRKGWRGLLVEAFPGTFYELLQKHRKAYSLQAALSLTNVSAIVKFQTGGPKGVLGHITSHNGPGVTVQAFPLYAILQALNVTTVDFLSLDVEGFELRVLATVPWDKVKVRVMSVEWHHVPGGLNAVRSFMVSKGYRFLGDNGEDAWFGWPGLLDKPVKKH